MYAIKFQNRGFSHAHILIFLHPSNKYLDPEEFKVVQFGLESYASWILWFGKQKITLHDG